jgi:predicted NBD/HSP70 family sugar kinase
MGMFAGLDVGGKRTAAGVVDKAGKIVFRGMVDTHPRHASSDARFGLEAS